jgi:AcrR family transcriptional regulator
VAVIDSEPIDGRHARRERNRIAVLDAVIELFATDTLIPSVEEVAKRSGLSLRSVYRYYEDLGALLHAAIQRSMENAAPLLRIEGIGVGPLDRRISGFLDSRLALYEQTASSHRATIHHATHNQPMADALVTAHTALRQQLERQFEPELRGLMTEPRGRLVRAADVLTRFEAIEALHIGDDLSIAEIKEVLTVGLLALFSSQV